LIIDSTERILKPEERSAVDIHTSHCPRCRSFREEFEDVRMDRKTRALYLGETRTLQVSAGKRTLRRTALASVPGFIWAALAVLIIMTAVLVVSFVGDLKQGWSLTFSNVGLLTLLAQNAVMLLFIPVIMRKVRHQQAGSGRLANGLKHS
jgi:hypothetical protein